MERTNRPDLGCAQVREAISAVLDREPAPLDAEAVERHLAGCAGCSTFSVGATTLDQRLRSRPTEVTPNLAPAILGAVPLPGRDAGDPLGSGWRPGGSAWWARGTLVLVALVELVLALPELVLGDESGASVHVARELGAWDVALAIAWLAVVLRPARAVGLLPFASALAAVMVGTATLDVLDGHRPAIAELHHGLGLVGLACTWMLARSVPRVERLLPSFR